MATLIPRNVGIHMTTKITDSYMMCFFFFRPERNTLYVNINNFKERINTALRTKGITWLNIKMYTILL